MEVIPYDGVSTRHLHILPSLPDTQLRTLLTPELDAWLLEMEERHSLDTVPLEPRIAPSHGLYDIPIGIEVGNGPILLRIVNSQVYSEDINNHQMVVRLASTSDNNSFEGTSAISCPTGKSGHLQDYLLLYLKNIKIQELNDLVVEIHLCPVENAIEQRVQTKSKSFKSRATGIFKLRSNARPMDDITGIGSNVLDGPMVTIPLAALFHTPEPLCLAATYFITFNGHPSGSAIGQVSLSMIASPTAFTSLLNSTLIPPNLPFQNYLTLCRDSQCWRRWWAILVGARLCFHNFQRHERASGQRPIDLHKMVAIQYCSRVPELGGLEHVLKVKLEDQANEVLMYADNEKAGLQWADAIHQAVWNRPYMVTDGADHTYDY